ncbi:hypothetical protein COCMIDRAFT_3934 [Bipolaris oryzae ATCC 44560]|uniref:Uncharacterized protein n=1 Tax=Bipolaris oryzae ATCC 44560 TaxID=930090 RepID=W6ZB68_COCMI|nr:uncharacterized protein COCMIDRAFT_3934 [Bipolaris oryzae ATCC 44560]EUC47078.1 hypothetical protein COCMIDRAFT_3934 [Bipolaris oryzae ATCC 44560]
MASASYVQTHISKTDISGTLHIGTHEVRGDIVRNNHTNQEVAPHIEVDGAQQENRFNVVFNLKGNILALVAIVAIVALVIALLLIYKHDITGDSTDNESGNSTSSTNSPLSPGTPNTLLDTSAALASSYPLVPAITTALSRTNDTAPTPTNTPSTTSQLSWPEDRAPSLAVQSPFSITQCSTPTTQSAPPA